MTLFTTKELLELHETAIQEIMTTGQSYAMGEHRLTRADLGILEDRHEKLKKKYESETLGSTRNLFRFRNPQ